LKNVQFCSSPRKAKILTTGIHGVFRGLKFEPDPPEFFGGGKRGRFSKVSFDLNLALTFSELAIYRNNVTL